MGKICRQCGIEQSLSSYSPHSKGRLRPDCKSCTAANARASYSIPEVRERRQRANRKYSATPGGKAVSQKSNQKYCETPRGREARARAAKLFKIRHPIKRAANMAVKGAIKSGRLTRQPCEVCGNDKAQAHHDDYSKPLDVRWLCTKHHAEWHKHNEPLCPEQGQAA